MADSTGADSRGSSPFATTAAGPELAALLGEDNMPALGDEELLAYLVATERVKAWTDARAMHAMRELTRRCARLRGVGDGPNQVSARQVAADEVAAALCLSPLAARRRVELAADLARLPATGAALSAGRLDLRRAQAIVDGLAPLRPTRAAAVEAWAAEHAPGRTVSQLTAALRRVVIAADPAAAERRRQAAVDERGVWREALPDGMSRLEWIAPSAQVESGWQWVNAAAKQAQAGDRARANEQRDAGAQPGEIDEVRTLDQCRSDVLADLTVHRLATDPLPTQQGRQPHIGVVVAASTLAGADERPAELTGVGPVTADYAREIAAGGVWQRLLTDPTGQLVEIGVDKHDPPQWMRDLVVARDQTCRAPGCRQPAARCELDHTVEHPVGPTSPSNLRALCKRHHRLKTFTDATYRVTPDGEAHWTLPTGATHRRPAEPLLDTGFRLGPPDASRLPPNASGLDPPPF